MINQQVLGYEMIKMNLRSLSISTLYKQYNEDYENSDK